jgi:hemerythrin superfamily protein
VPEPATADTAFPHGRDVDVVDLLLTQHARIEEQFLLVVGASGTARQEAFDDLVRLLAMHETAEEEVVHPLSRTIEGDAAGLVDDRLAEERQAKEMLATLLGADVDSPGFATSLLLLRDAVLTHARYEERYEFPRLRAKVPAERLRTLASLVRAAEAAAPTRPHPGVESATANLLAGPALAVADRVRDLVRAATRGAARGTDPQG